MKDALAMHQAGRLKDAEGLYLRFLESDPDNADALRLLGVVKHQLGDSREGERLISRAIEVEPTNAKAHDNLGFLKVALGDFEAASAAYARAATLNPGDEITHHNLGRVRYQLRKLDDAVASYRRALEINPDSSETNADLAAALVDQEAYDEAIAAYRRAIALDPGRANAHGGLAGTLLANDEPEAALNACDAWLARSPHDTLSLSLKAVALAELGDMAGAREIQDFERLVQRTVIGPPQGYNSVEAFNAELADYLREHPTRRNSPVGNATRKGWHTRDISGEAARCVAVMQSVIRAATEDYVARGKAETGHPFFDHVPSEFGLEMWGIVMEEGGHQTPHVHPTGWLSGVYYASLPNDLGADEADGAGWIQFGEARDDLYHRTRPVRDLVKPAEGLLVLFPSYFWHSTIPTHTHLERVSLAFDVQRAG